VQHIELEVYVYAMLALESYVSARFFDLLFGGGELTEEGDIVFIPSWCTAIMTGSNAAQFCEGVNALTDRNALSTMSRN